MKKTIIFISILLFSCIINADTVCPAYITCSTNNISSCALYYPWEKITHTVKQIYGNHFVVAIVKNQGETASCYYTGGPHSDQNIILYDITNTLIPDLTPWNNNNGWRRSNTGNYTCTADWYLCPFKFVVK